MRLYDSHCPHAPWTPDHRDEYHMLRWNCCHNEDHHHHHHHNPPSPSSWSSSWPSSSLFSSVVSSSSSAAAAADKRATLQLLRSPLWAAKRTLCELCQGRASSRRGYGKKRNESGPCGNSPWTTATNSWEQRHKKRSQHSRSDFQGTWGRS